MTYTAISLMMMMASVGALGFPLGVPPAEEDPVLLNVAPADALVYMNWAGMAQADPDSENHTERMLADPEIQQFIREIERMIRGSIDREMRRGRVSKKQALLAERGPTLVKRLFTSGAAVFVWDVKIEQRKPPQFKAGMVVTLDEHAEETEQALLDLQRAWLGVATKARVAGLSGYTIALGPDAPPLFWAVHEKRLWVALGAGAIDQMRDAAKTDPPEWLTALRKRLPIERRGSTSYFNTKRIAQLFKPTLGAEADLIGRVVDALGVGSITAVNSSAGLDRDGYVTRTLLVTDGEPKGLFSLAGKPLSNSDLRTIPRDATLAAAANVDMAEALNVALQIARAIEPRAEDEFREGLARFKKQTGVDLKDDLLDTLGDTWTLYNSPGEGGLLVTGLTLTVELDDHRRFAETHDKLLKLVEAQLARQRRFRAERDRRFDRKEDDLRFEREDVPRFEKKGDPKPESPGIKPPPSGALGDVAVQPVNVQGEANRAAQVDPYVRGPRISRYKFADHTIYTLRGMDDFPLAPSWCVTKDHLVVSLFPQNIKAFLTRDERFESVAKVDEVGRLLDGPSPPFKMLYYDSKAWFDTFYPVLQIGATMLAGQLSRELNVEINPAILPSAASISRHLRPGMMSVARTPNGFEIANHQSIPGSDTITTAALGMALVFPAMAKVNETMREMESMSRMHNHSMALRAYETSRGHLPLAYSTTKDGEPGLSWRVHLLPYLAEKKLYDEFRLDEPWDSEHNRKLIERMPKIYESPNRITRPSHTVYQTIRHPKSAFPGTRGLKVKRISDGESNTIAFVEANRPVIWTKPDDLTFDSRRPVEFQLNTYSGTILVAMLDGSVHRLTPDIWASEFEALVTINGREPISVDEFVVSGSRRRGLRKPVRSPAKTPAPRRRFDKTPKTPASRPRLEKTEDGPPPRRRRPVPEKTEG